MAPPWGRLGPRASPSASGRQPSPGLTRGLCVVSAGCRGRCWGRVWHAAHPSFLRVKSGGAPAKAGTWGGSVTGGSSWAAACSCRPPKRTCTLISATLGATTQA